MRTCQRSISTRAENQTRESIPEPLTIARKLIKKVEKKEQAGRELRLLDGFVKIVPFRSRPKWSWPYSDWRPVNGDVHPEQASYTTLVGPRNNGSPPEARVRGTYEPFPPLVVNFKRVFDLLVLAEGKKSEFSGAPSEKVMELLRVGVSLSKDLDAAVDSLRFPSVSTGDRQDQTMPNRFFILQDKTSGGVFRLHLRTLKTRTNHGTFQLNQRT
ncbi:hypothetical protein CSUB01_10397 [Colletotrichum sublineola]|uniref:Uncharacterized protein n=1 Tax=Colletotrichum sublineola TaxID=1173701 RepID=A0A066XTN8_COLSU|nr:hypothetical protein CSUB01_10397 [Colletotrichum sublineola]